MKKHQLKTARIAVLGYSAAMAVAGSMISLDAIAGCTDGSASGAITCNFPNDGSTPFADAWSITGSNNVKANLSVSATGFAICSWHGDGKKSFGLTLAGGSMAIRDGTGKSVDTSSGCAS